MKLFSQKNFTLFFHFFREIPCFPWLKITDRLQFKIFKRLGVFFPSDFKGMSEIMKSKKIPVEYTPTAVRSLGGTTRTFRLAAFCAS